MTPIYIIDVKTGRIKRWIGEIIPDGYLEADGALHSGIVYPELDELYWNKETESYIYGGAPYSRLFRTPDFRLKVKKT